MIFQTFFFQNAMEKKYHFEAKINRWKQKPTKFWSEATICNENNSDSCSITIRQFEKKFVFTETHSY